MENFGSMEKTSDQMLEEILAHYEGDSDMSANFKKEWDGYSPEQQRSLHEQFMRDHGKEVV